MRHILALLLLALCLCGCTYAAENPYQKAAEEISAQIDTEKSVYAAAALQKFYESGETTADLRTIDDGLGGVFVFDGAADGVYSLAYDSESYDRQITEFADDNVIYINLVVGIILILLVFYLSSSLCRVYLFFKNGRRSVAECLPSGVIVLVVSTISLFVVVLGLDCVTIASGPTAPEVVREFLRVSVAEDRGKFYSRSEVRDLLQEYAVKYGTETSAAEKGNIQS